MLKRFSILGLTQKSNGVFGTSSSVSGLRSWQLLAAVPTKEIPVTEKKKPTSLLTSILSISQ